MDPECPVCLEQLTGTLVELGCCHKRVHIQCYVSTCPMCRATLPVPIHAIPNQPSHVIIPVPVAFPPSPISRWRILAENSIIILGVWGLTSWIVSTYFQ
jgi:hypothetical protein